MSEQRKYAVEMPRPVEIVGNHWIHRDSADTDAKFYRRDEVEAMRDKMQDQIDIATKLCNDNYAWAKRLEAERESSYKLEEFQAWFAKKFPISNAGRLRAGDPGQVQSVEIYEVARCAWKAAKERVDQ